MLSQHSSRITLMVGLSAATLLMTGPALAVSQEELIQIIRQQSEQLKRMEKRLDELETKGVETDKKAEEAKKIAEKSDGDVGFKMTPAPTFTSRDGNFQVKLRGRLFADYNYVKAKKDDNLDTSSPSIREARIGIDGKMWRDFKYRIEVDFGNSDINLKDAYIEYVGDYIDPISYIRIGQHRTPNSLEALTSSRFITFQERASFINAFGFDRQIGIETGINGEQSTFHIGAFGQNAKKVETANNGGVTVAARATHKFNLGEESQTDEFIHVGASTRWRDLDNQVDDSMVEYRARPELKNTNATINTGNVPATDDVFVGPEFAFVYGPFSVQSELGWSWVNRSSGDNATEIWGGYLGASYFITGETRRYSKGKFIRPRAKKAIHEGGPGAWQVALRADYLDLNDGGANIKGGKQISIIPAINWWLTNHTQARIEYAFTHVFDARPQAGDFGDASVGNGSQNDVHAFGARAQVDF